MISINYQQYGTGFNLRLRLYQDGETKFISVNKMLKGQLSKRHWNAKKQCFIPSAPFSEENNQVLASFRHKYDIKAAEYSGGLSGFMDFVDGVDENASDGITLMQVLQDIISELKKRKHDDGTTKGSYECYEKLDRRMEEFFKYIGKSYAKFPISKVDSDMVNSVFSWITSQRGGSGYVYISKMLHATLSKAEDMGVYDTSILKGVRWKNSYDKVNSKYNTLSNEQCARLISLRYDELPENPNAQLYLDFCIFILFTGQSSCDAIALKQSNIVNIDGVDHFVFRRRKISEKQKVPCSVPVNEIMRGIIERYRPVSSDGYIFPIRNKKKLELQKTNNGDIKHFIGRLNIWLKKLGKILGCNFPLRTYTFRHTAITSYISKSIPVIYVANMTGTSVENCEKIYYNNQGDVTSRDKVLKAIKF